MNFDLSPEQKDIQARARDVATNIVAAEARAIDEQGRLPASVKAALDGVGLLKADQLALVVAVEEIAAASATAAALACLEDGPSGDFAGLRGVPRQEAAGDRQYLALGAVCLGIGRAALTEALNAARQRGDRPAGEPSGPPHWALADAATEMDGARLLVHAAASGAGVSAAAAFVHAGGAATRAVDAALRLVGSDGFRTGSVLERAARDVRSAWLVLGSEDEARRLAADALLS
ncbi:MAG TPA: acyl-CoA dehydrogenase family protein [Vicinamibacterales bacterium]|nr:acyl-CoA dehydrogenase family protein [Vicinamibacterales bacterium]